MPVDPQTVIAAPVRADFVRGSRASVTPAPSAPTAPTTDTAVWSALKPPTGMLRLRRALRRALGLFG